MNKTFLSLVLLSVVPSIYAQSTTDTGSSGSKSRADVKAEVQKDGAKATGQNHFSDKPASGTNSGKSRAETKAGVTPESTYRDRQIETYRQDSTKGSGKSRADVKAEVAREGSQGTKQLEVSGAQSKNKGGSTKGSTTQGGAPATTQ